jgi:hypothetical protein
VSRSAAVNAPAAKAFEQINDFRRWTAWSPWERLDPAMQRSYAGPSTGTGAVYSWVGNKNVGEGRATIADSRPNESIKLNLEFFKPFKATNDVEFTFQPQGEQTLVTWAMNGRKNFMFKALGLVMNMDKMCGKQFAEGLANLKAVVEGESAPTLAAAR